MSTSLSSFSREFRAGGWRTLLGAAIGYGMGVTVLPYYTLGAFVQPLEAEFAWSRAAVQGSTLSVIAGTLVAASAWGWLTDRYGSRDVAIVSQIGLALTILLLAFNTGGLWFWYTAWFAMTVLGLGTSAITWTRSVVTRFSESRGFALAIALSGTGVSALVMPSMTALAIETIGWRYAYAILAASVIVVALPTTIWLLPRDRPGDASTSFNPVAETGEQTVSQIVRGFRFWILTVSLMMVGFAVSGLIPNIIPMMIDRGIEPTVAASLMGVLGISVVGGRLLTGLALDWMWAPIVAMIVLPVPAVACLLLETGISDFAAVAGCVALLGLATGAEFDMSPYFVTRYFGTKKYSQIFALQWIGFTIAAGSAPPIYGYLFDISGSYSLPLYISAGLLFSAPFLLLGLGRYPVFAVQDVAENPADVEAFSRA